MSKRMEGEESNPASRPSTSRQPAAGPADGALARQPATLDADALERLQALDPTGKNQLMARVVDAFGSSSARMLPQLHAAAASGDLAQVRHIAHTLKSSSANVGAARLSGLCADIELRMRQGAAERLVEAAADIAAEVVAVDDALRRLPTASR